MAITCPKCRTDNPETQRYCGSCGAPLPDAKDIRPEVTETIRTPVHDLTMGSTFAGRYQVIEELGHGGMGRVYKVFDTDIKEKIALKLLRPEVVLDKETVERFTNELKLARKIRHKNICGMFDLGKAEGTTFITMEFVAGEDLKKFIRKSGQLGAGRAVSIAKQICEGLAEAHQLGIVHRDLKPQNIMVDEDGNARIMDFGIARSLKVKGITGAGVMIGTPEYMSPEQVEGQEVDARSDIYSLGIILYEMLTGQVPFEGGTAFTVGVKQKSEPPKDPRELNAQIPPDLSGLILKCLEKDKAERYQNAESLRSDLGKIEQGLPTTERMAAKPKPFTSREITVKFKLKKLVIPVAAVVILAVAAVILWKVIPHKRAAAAPKIENSIAVVSFKNQTGDEAFDYLEEAIPNLLITNLENTGLFYVATWERMQDVLKQMGVKPARTIDSDLGFELCRREGIKAIAIGTFTKAGDVFRTDVKVLDTESKRLLKGANEKGTGINSILDSQIDALSREISLGLGVDKAKIEAAPLNVKDITTQSLEAYEYFVKGKEAYNLLNWDQAKTDMRAALEVDPSFAMAYVYLAWANYNTGDTKARNETIEKAMALSNKTSQKDRLYLEAGYALFIAQDLDKHEALLKDLVSKYPDEKWAFHYLGDFLWIYRNDLPAACRQYERWNAIDPHDFNALNHLINVNTWMGDLKKAAEYVKKHEAVAPPDPFFFLSQGNLYALMGQFDTAIAKSKEALAIQPDFTDAIFFLIVTHAVKEDFEESVAWANEYVAKASSLGSKSNAFFQRGFYNFWRGRFKNALSDFEAADEAADEAENSNYKSMALEGQGAVHVARREYNLGRTCFENSFKVTVGQDMNKKWLPENRAYLAWWLGLIAVDEGQNALAEAKLSEMKGLLPDIKSQVKEIMAVRGDLLQGEISLARGDLDVALAAAQKACGPGSVYWNQSYQALYVPHFSYGMDLQARALAKKGDTNKAIAEYNRLFTIDPRSAFFIHPLYHYRLGLLYEKAQDVDRAKAQYLKFLDLWKDADPGRPEVDEARKRLMKLTGG